MSRVQTLRSSFGRIFVVVLLVAFSLGLQGQILPAQVGAAGQISSRSITLGSSAVSTATTYKLTFTPATTVATPADLIIDFCSNSPLIGDTCSFATTSVPTISSPTSSVGTAATVGSGTPVHTVKVTGITGGLTAGTPITVNFTAGFTNSSAAGTFYARVLTYASGGAASYVPGNTSPATPTLGSPVDTGGIALSTATNIQINAKVYETMSFCVFQTPSCGTAPVLALGAPSTGALDTSTAYINTSAQYQLATNAGSGAVVTMTGQTLCRVTPLNFTNCPTGASASTITAIGNTATAVNGAHFGTEQFGACVNGSAALVPQAPYNDGACPTTATTSGAYSGAVTFGFNDLSTSGGTNNAAGSTVLQATAAVPLVTNNFSFAANIAATTEAGLYQSNLNLVATGTF